ncbi:MAG: HlyD family efflux transporter periplasmic adaptor subunit [Planctomycetota bacterium]|nr:HlyD family efflux transporter periplasmic adaptor subunit [Planctomycetota bacterium]
MKNQKFWFGYATPALLIFAGVVLSIFLEMPEPEKSRLANPNNEGELLEYLPAAKVEPVQLLNENLVIEANGTVIPYREIQLGAQVAGRVVEKNPMVRSGNYVEKDDLLYRIDPRDFELDVKRLEQRIAQEEATIAETELDIQNSDKLIEVAQEQMDLASKELSRFENIKAGLTSGSELDAARRAQLTAQNQLVTLKNQRSSSQKRLDRMKLSVQLVETELKQAKLNLERTNVISPVSGRVVVEQVEADSFVQRGTPMLTIEDTEKVEVACNIRMDQLSWILEQPNTSAAQLVSDAQSSRLELPETEVDISFEIGGRNSERYTWQGKLDRIDGAGLDPQSRTVPIRILVENPRSAKRIDGSQADLSSPMLVRGMFVDVRIKAMPTTRLLLVPKLAIKPANNASVVWKFSEDRSVIRESDKAKAAIKAYEESESAGTVDELYGSKGEDEEQETKNYPEPGDWDAGHLSVVEGVRMVAAYWDDKDYWVCEVSAQGLEPGDMVIVTPLPGVKADGSDMIRIEKSEGASDVAAAKETVAEDEGSKPISSSQQEPS